MIELKLMNECSFNGWFMLESGKGLVMHEA
jgi:hypothetical protein